MRNITLVLDDTPYAQVLLETLQAWAARQRLAITCLYEPQMETAAAGYAPVPAADTTHPALGHGLMDSITQLDLYVPGQTDELLKRKAQFADLVVMGPASLHQLICPVHTSGKAPVAQLDTPIYVPPQVQQPARRLLLLANPKAVKQVFHYRHLLADIQEVYILSGGLLEPEQEKQLVRYVQSYFPNPAYLHLHDNPLPQLEPLITSHTLLSAAWPLWPGATHALCALTDGLHDQYPGLSLFVTPS